MFEVVSNEEIAPQLHRMVVAAPRVARARKPGQFVIVRAGDESERIPLTIADDDPQAGTITLIIQAVGRSTQDIVAVPAGQSLRDVAGPLGQPTHIARVGRVVCVGGGAGTAVLYPLAKALAAAGNELITIIGGRSAPYVVLRDELGAISDELLLTTEDGSLGETGFVTAPLQRLLDDENGGRPAAVYAVGPVPMMKAVVNLTARYGVPTTVSLNPLMVDGTGMCGGCRVTVGGETKFACVDGPEFDGLEVDFDELAGRQSTYHELDEHGCRILAQIPAEPPAEEPRLTNKERMAIDRVAMPEQDAAERATNFTEVNLGLTEELAVLEANRCIACKNHPCVAGCPVEVRIPDFLERVAAADFAGAAEVLLTDNALPATTGRVCPQEVQCEGLCLRGKKGEPVAIGWLERFVADWAAANTEFVAPQVTATGHKVAVVGAGPGGLTVAGELARMGHGVHIFEALHDTGGVLRYGIPEFRLPKRIVDAEVENLRRLGVEVECDVIVGRTLTVQELMNDFDAVFVANGAGLPMFLNVPGENLKGVYSANEYLTRVNLMGAYRDTPGGTPIMRGKRVVVFGGGNVAMDAVRTAKRLGAEQAICAYRRTRAEMPARIEEIAHAEQEGIDFQFLLAPLAILGDGQGWVRAVKMQRMELGEPDDSGRRRPVPIAGSEFELECDVAVVALGTIANPLLTNATPAIEVNRWGNIVTDDTHATSMPGVFAGGDIVRGGATVILAMGDGKAAARAIDTYLKERAPA
ncbi:MAG TPA: NADPH-dependent glutamate synthase [Thermoleophilia bacterium]|nr:NADPH-dependent glutamate synthase [Thermoleophilia bacterium]